MTETADRLETSTHPQTAGDERPALAEGVQLLGEYEDSGFKEAPLMVQRTDGQVVQLSRLLYLVAEHADGRHTYEEIASQVSREFQRELTADNAKYLADEKLRPLGVLKLADGSEPQVERVNPFLALKFKTGLIPDGIVRALTTVFKPLYFPPVLLALLGAFVAFDYWLFAVHGIGSGLRQVLYQPGLLFFLFAMLVGATAFHEIGHATACRYGGAKPGKIGVGLYLVWPAFYTDVTDSYRLGRWGRIRTDLGGVYFNAIFILVEAALYYVTGFEAFIVAILVQHFEMIHQFLPFVRLDGYYVVSDLVGVPDLFQRMGPILRSMLPGRKDDPRVAELKPKVRYAVTTWVLLVIPILALNLGLIVLHAPRIYGTAWDSLGKQIHHVSSGWAHGHYIAVATSAFQIFALGVPLLGIAYMIVRLSKTATVGAWTSSAGRPMLRTAYMSGFALLIAFVGYMWWPRGEYKPIGKHERWTLQAGLASFKNMKSGKAGLTPADPKVNTNPVLAPPSASAAPGAPTGSSTNSDNTFTTPSGFTPQPTAGGIQSTPAPTSAPTPAATTAATPVASPAPTP